MPDPVGGTGTGPFSGLDPDRDSARDLLRRELNEPGYNRPDSLVERVLTWVQDRLADLLGAVQGSGSAVLLVLLLLVVALAVAALVAVGGRRRGRTLRQGAPGAVVEDPRLSAADYRARAAAAGARGDWDEALLDSYRALAVGAVERALLTEAVSLTAHEIGARLGALFPEHGAELRQAADTFDDVRYGGGRAGTDLATRMAGLEADVSRSTPRAEALTW